MESVVATEPGNADTTDRAWRKSAADVRRPNTWRSV